MASIPVNIIEDIKHRCNVEDIISQYLSLNRAGSNLKGLCPFHSEKTPSFVVFPSNQNFYCFGCGAGGDVISFIMRAENLEYPDAVQFLADKVGISLPKDNNFNEMKGTTRSRVLEMNICAAKFFRNMLFDEKVGKTAREYVSKRQLTQLTIKHFGLGYAPDSFNMLHDHLKANGYTDDEMVDAYLCARSKKNNSVYDIFRGRLMFPIIDTSGNIVAFGGRVLDNSTPKYLNTSDTPAFKKSKNLFALNYSKQHCEEYLILCEGYMDVVQLHQAGFENAVATLGTAITPEQARIFKRYTPKVIISYDSDGAGQNASQKAFKMLGDVGVDTKIIKLDGAKDPDEYIKKFGANAFKKVLGESRSQFDFVVDKTVKKYDVNNLDDKVKILKELCEYIATIPSNIEKELYVTKLSKQFDVDAKSIKRDVEIAERKMNKKTKADNFSEIVRQSSGSSDRVNYDFAKVPRVAKLEEIVLGLILFNNSFIDNVVDGKSVNKDDFITSFGLKLFDVVDSHYKGDGFDMAFLSEELTQEEVSRAIQMVAKRQQFDNNSDNVFVESLRDLRNEIEKEKSKNDDIMSIISRRRKENK